MSKPCRGFTGRLFATAGCVGDRVPFCLGTFLCSTCSSRITGFFSSWDGGGEEKKASTPLPEDCFRLLVSSSNSSGGRLLLAIDYFLNHCPIRCRAFMVGELHDNRRLKPGRLSNPHRERDIGIKHADAGVVRGCLQGGINLYAVEGSLVILCRQHAQVLQFWIGNRSDFANGLGEHIQAPKRQ